MDLQSLEGQDRFSNALQSILKECDSQDEKWGEQHHFNHVWLSILIEEIGEASKSLNELEFSNLEKELVQSAAVLVQWISDTVRKDE